MFPLVLLAFVSEVHASDDPAPPEAPTHELAFGLRALFEVWQEPAIAQVYHPSRLMPGGWASLGLGAHHYVAIDIAFLQMPADSEDATAPVFQMMPLGVMGGWVVDLGVPVLQLGAGPVATPFTESMAGSAVSGVKLGLEGELVLRCPTDLTQPSLDVRSHGLRRTDVLLSIGRRQLSLLSDTGLDLSAWRLGVGLVGVL